MSIDTIVFIGVTPIHTPCDRTRAPCPTNNREGGGVWSNGVVGPFFFEGNVTSDNDLQMLEDSIIAELEKHSNFQTMLWQQEGAPPHDGRAVREYLDNTFTEWMGRRGTIEWPARSPDLTPCAISHDGE